MNECAASTLPPARYPQAKSGKSKPVALGTRRSARFEFQAIQRTTPVQGTLGQINANPMKPEHVQGIRTTCAPHLAGRPSPGRGEKWPALSQDQQGHSRCYGLLHVFVHSSARHREPIRYTCSRTACRRQNHRPVVLRVARSDGKHMVAGSRAVGKVRLRAGTRADVLPTRVTARWCLSSNVTAVLRTRTQWRAHGGTGAAHFLASPSSNCHARAKVAGTARGRRPEDPFYGNHCRRVESATTMQAAFPARQTQDSQRATVRDRDRNGSSGRRRRAAARRLARG